MKLHIFYRHYNIKGKGNESRPHWFTYEKCYNNLISSLKWGSDNYKINIVYDSIDYNWIKDSPYNKLYEIEAKEDMKSFWETIKIANSDLSIKEEDLIYFLENDYMHVNGWLNKVIELFSTYQGLDYVSLYDHNDKYFHPMYDNLTSKIFTSPSHHWRTTPSTCGSFIVTKERFNEDFDILSTMRGDHNKWLWLNEHRSRSVITPIPGLSTHCMNNLLSPTIKWEKI